MCGIVGYVGPDQALPIVLEGLRRLEYRGYDSAGVAMIDSGLSVVKRAGKLSELDVPPAPPGLRDGLGGSAAGAAGTAGSCAEATSSRLGQHAFGTP